MSAATCCIFVLASVIGATVDASSLRRPQVVSTEDHHLQEPLNYHRQVLMNTEDISYTGEFIVGGQTLRAIIDTGSFENVIFGQRCTSFDCQSAIELPNFYDADASSTYRNSSLTQALFYGSGDVYTQLGFDTFEIGPHKVRNVYFWEVVEAYMPLMQSAEFHAILGVGPPLTADIWAENEAEVGKDMEARAKQEGEQLSPSVKDRIDSAIALAEQSENLKTLLEEFGTTSFSVCFQPRPGSEGYFIWNDHKASELLEVFERLPVADSEIWAPSLQMAMLNGGREDSRDVVGCNTFECSALLDSGTSLLAVPFDVYDRMFTLLNNIPDVCEDFNLLPDLVFTLGGKTHALPPTSYIGEIYGEFSAEVAPYVPHLNFTKGGVSLRERPPRQCELLLMSGFEQDFWILGMPFFRTYYTTFDLGSEPRASHEERAIYTALTDDTCTHPSQVSPSNLAAAAALRRDQPMRRIDASKVQVSRKGLELLNKTPKRSTERL